MSSQTIGQLAVKVRVLAPEDSIGRACEAVRASTVGAAPVVTSSRLVGLVTAYELGQFLASHPEIDPEETRVDALPLEQAVALPEGISPQDALRFFQANGLMVAPVLDFSGCLVGMISLSELSIAVCRRVKPPVIGGMATPFGVYLTGGGVRGGVGDLALVSTGAFMAALNLLAFVLAEWLFSPGGLLRLQAFAAWFGSLHEGARAQWEIGVGFLLFAGMFRVSWVTGYHAAEHQVVHAMEAGDDLHPEVVRSKPRVHPRCGTNLVVAAGIMSASWHYLRLGEYTPIVAMAMTFFLWRRVGGWVQQHVTTRVATPQQIESGIFAGRQLMHRFQQDGPRGGFGRRIWNMGLLQVLGGAFLVTALLGLLQLLGVPLPVSLRF